MEYNEQQEFMNIVKKLFININILKRNPSNYADEILIYNEYRKKYGNSPEFKTVMNSAFSDLSKRIPSEKEKNDYIEASKTLYIQITVLKKDRNNYLNEIDTYRTFRRFYLSPVELKQITDYSIAEAKIFIARTNEIIRQQKQPVSNVTPTPTTPVVLPNVVYNQPPVTNVVSSSTIPPPPATNVVSSSTITPPPATNVVSSSTIPPPPATNVVSSSTIPPPPVTNVVSSSTITPPPVTNVVSSSTIPPPPVTNVVSSSTIQPPPATNDVVSSSAIPPPPVTNVVSLSENQPPPVENAVSQSQLPNVVYSQEPPNTVLTKTEISDISTQQIDSIVSKIYSSQTESQKELNVDISPSMKQIGDNNYDILQKALLKDKILKYERMKKFPEITSKDEEIAEYNRTNFFDDTLNYLKLNNISTDKFLSVIKFSEYRTNEIKDNSITIETLSKNIDSNQLKQIEKISDSDYLVYILRDRKNNINKTDLIKLIDNEFYNISQKNSFSNEQIDLIRKRADNIVEGFYYNRFIGIY